MNTALLIVGTLLIAFLISALVLSLYICSKSLNLALSNSDQIHARATKHLDDTLDRLMAIDFQEYKAWRAAETNEQGGWEPAEEAEPTPQEQIVPKRWGMVDYTPVPITPWKDDEEGEVE